jgi:hypothetical protein
MNDAIDCCSRLSLAARFARFVLLRSTVRLSCIHNLIAFEFPLELTQHTHNHCIRHRLPEFASLIRLSTGYEPKALVRMSEHTDPQPTQQAATEEARGEASAASGEHTRRVTTRSQAQRVEATTAQRAAVGSSSASVASGEEQS